MKVLWTEDEIQDLLLELKNKQTVKEIAYKHRRSETAILSKIYDLIVTLKKRKFNEDMIASHLHISKNMIDNIIQLKGKRKLRSMENKEQKKLEDIIYNMEYKINHIIMTLKRIENKINT